jgi:hypothetical protein
VQLTELLFQKVKDLPGQGQIPFKAGYGTVVSRSPSLRAALLAPLCPSPDDQKRLQGEDGPARVGVGFVGASATPYRLLREIGGARQLLKLDPETRKFTPLTDDQLEIDSFLRTECGLPSLDAYASFFVVEGDELPSVRGKTSGARPEPAAPPVIKALQEELELTRQFEGMQDRIFKIATRLDELRDAGKQLRDAEAELAQAEKEVARSPWSNEQIADLTARANRAKDDARRREDALAEIARKRQRLIDEETPPAGRVLADPFFGGGIAAGALLDALAFALRRPFVSLIALVPYLAALIAMLRWIEADEAEKESIAASREIKEREIAAVKAHDAESAPLKAALSAAQLREPDDLLALFRERETTARRRDEARERLAASRADPEMARIEAEVPALAEEKDRLEAQVLAMGFTRSAADVEADIERAAGGERSRAGAGGAQRDAPKLMLDRAAALLGVGDDELFEQVGPRLSAYLLALTDRRVAGAKRDGDGGLLLAATDGRSGPYAGLPMPLRDLVYTALRLALIERVASQKKLPVVVDDAFAALEPGKQQLVAKMLKGIAAQAQVIHRVAEAPQAGPASQTVTS